LILITGATRYVANVVARRLLSEGQESDDPDLMVIRARSLHANGSRECAPDNRLREAGQSELHAGAGSGSAFAAKNGLNVNAIRNAPRPMIHDPT
jgi:hypothetical protein